MEDAWAGAALALQGPGLWPPSVLVSRGGEDAAERGRWQPVPDLHGRRDRLRAAGVRPHGHLHQVRQEDERVPHLPAVRRAGRARLQILTQPCPQCPGQDSCGQDSCGQCWPRGTRQPRRFAYTRPFQQQDAEVGERFFKQLLQRRAGQAQVLPHWPYSPTDCWSQTVYSSSCSLLKNLTCLYAFSTRQVVRNTSAWAC